MAIWAFGSLKNYSQAANQYLEDQGLVETHVGSDASGFNPSTTSTARDLVRIGELVMQDPVLKQIVGQSSASDFPVVNNIKNVNSLLGTRTISLASKPAIQTRPRCFRVGLAGQRQRQAE